MGEFGDWLEARRAGKPADISASEARRGIQAIEAELDGQFESLGEMLSKEREGTIILRNALVAVLEHKEATTAVRKLVTNALIDYRRLDDPDNGA